MTKKNLSKSRKEEIEKLDASFQSPNLTQEQKLQSDQITLEYLQKVRANRTEEDILKAKLLQLKFMMEDYIKQTDYDFTKSFAFFLREYIYRLNLKNYEFAEEIDIKPTVISQLVNNHREPNTELMRRLEAHSNEIFPAIVWYKIANKGKEYLFLMDDKMKMAEQKHVKKRLTFNRF